MNDHFDTAVCDDDDSDDDDGFCCVCVCVVNFSAVFVIEGEREPEVIVF